MEFPTVSKMVPTINLPFCFAYLHETELSALIVIKKKSEIMINSGKGKHALCMVVPNIQPSLGGLCKYKQADPSH